MTKFKAPALLCSLVFLLSSCFVKNRGPVTSYNGPAFYNNDISYLPKPISADSIHHAFYLSGSLMQGVPANDKDDFSAQRLNLGVGFTTRHFNFATAAFGAAGSFHNGTVPDTQAHYITNKFAGMVGGRASINYYVKVDNVDIRIIGVEAGYSHEFGSYAVFRKQVAGQPYFFVDTRTNLFTIGGSTEATWYGRDPSFQYGLRLFVGQTNYSYPFYLSYNGTSPDHPRLAMEMSYFMQIKNYFMIGEISRGGGQFTLGYRFQ